MASVQDSTGVHLDRGMCEEKRTDEPISYSRHLELGNGSAADIESPEGSPARGERSESNPGCVPAEVERRPRANGDQPQEDVIGQPGSQTRP